MFMKKKIYLMTLAAILCSTIITAVFTSCKKDDDKYNYTINVRAGGTLFGDNAVNWSNTIMNIYKAELGTDDDSFTKYGTEEECNQEVLNACKRAETTANRVGGAGDIWVDNTTTRQTVYRRNM